MSTVENNEKVLEADDTIDLYKNQLNYQKYVAKKLTVYKYLFLAASLVNLAVMAYFLPVFSYQVNGNSRTNDPEVWGDYTFIDVFRYGIAGEMGKRSFYNNLLLVFAALTIVSSVYLIVSAIYNVVVKKADINSTIYKVLGYPMAEVVASLFVVFVIGSFFCVGVNFNGSVSVLNGFWAMVVCGIVMICTSIPLSIKRID